MTLNVFFLAAESAIDNLLNVGKPVEVSGFLKRDTLIIVGAVAGVSLIVFFWAYFIRKRPVTSRHGGTVLYRTPRTASPGGRDPGESVGSSGRRRKRKRRPDHPDNLPRNPTLAEAGGLPPLRPDESDPPPASPSSPPTT